MTTPRSKNRASTHPGENRRAWWYCNDIVPPAWWFARLARFPHWPPAHTQFLNTPSVNPTWTQFGRPHMDAVRPMRDLLSSRYEQLSLKGNRFKSFQPATQSEMLDLISCLAVVDSTMPQDSSAFGLNNLALRKCNGLKKFIDSHCIERAYCVSIGKLCWKHDVESD